MRVLVLHDEDPAEARPDELDTLDQAAAVAAALRARGHPTTLAPCGLNLHALVGLLAEVQPDVVFNLVESVARSGRLAHLPALALEHLGAAFTGGSAEALFLANDKLLTKLVLGKHGLPAPDCLTLAQLDARVANGTSAGPGPWLAKAVGEHGSLGIGDDSVLEGGDAVALAGALRVQRVRFGGVGFLERYVHGREFNVAVLEVDGAPVCLPLAEIVFSAAFAGRPLLVGYAAKWDPTSPDYAGTERVFAPSAADAALHAELARLALSTWRAFALRGYARVDFRVDPAGQPWIIDVNVNPCLTPDAGFAATLAQGGIDYGAALEHILAAARLRREEADCR